MKLIHYMTWKIQKVGMMMKEDQSILGKILLHLISNS